MEQQRILDASQAGTCLPVAAPSDETSKGTALFGSITSHRCPAHTCRKPCCDAKGQSKL